MQHHVPAHFKGNSRHNQTTYWLRTCLTLFTWITGDKTWKTSRYFLEAVFPELKNDMVCVKAIAWLESMWHTKDLHFIVKNFCFPYLSRNCELHWINFWDRFCPEPASILLGIIQSSAWQKSLMILLRRKLLMCPKYIRNIQLQQFYVIISHCLL